MEAVGNKIVNVLHPPGITVPLDFSSHNAGGIMLHLANRTHAHTRSYAQVQFSCSVRICAAGGDAAAVAAADDH